VKRQPLPTVTSCDGCGACCTEQCALPVALVGDGDSRMPAVAPLPESLQAELQAMVRHFNETGWPPDGSACVWYDAQARRCKHHEHRPVICRDMQVGGDACLRWRRSKGIDPQPRWSFRGGRVVKEVR